MSRYVPLTHLHDPSVDRFVPREWMAGINRLFRFNRNMPSCLVAVTEPISMAPNIFNTIPWDSVLLDTDGMFDPQTSPTQLTVRTPGLWWATWGIVYGLTSDTTLPRETRCFRNRQEEMIQAVNEASNDRFYGPTRGFMAYLEDGEFLELDVWLGSSGTSNEEVSAPFFFGMYLLASPTLEAQP